MVRFLSDSIYVPGFNNTRYYEIFVLPAPVDTDIEREVDWILRCYGEEK